MHGVHVLRPEAQGGLAQSAEVNSSTFDIDTAFGWLPERRLLNVTASGTVREDSFGISGAAAHFEWRGNPGCLRYRPPGVLRLPDRLDEAAVSKVRLRRPKHSSGRKEQATTVFAASLSRYRYSGICGAFHLSSGGSRRSSNPRMSTTIRTVTLRTPPRDSTVLRSQLDVACHYGVAALRPSIVA